jgi:hypothetical protein
VPRNTIFYDFCTPAPQKLHDMGSEVLHKYSFVWSLQSHQLSLELRRSGFLDFVDLSWNE